jgi:hypothetical protein
MFDERRLIEYLPGVLQDVREYKALMFAEQPEIPRLFIEIQRALDNQFVETSDEYGIKRREEILKIVPLGTDELDTRRARVLLALGLKLPYTLRWLENWLGELCGEGNYGLYVADYDIDLDLSYDTVPEPEKITADVVRTLLAVKPANMTLSCNALRRSDAELLIGGTSKYALTVDVYPEV